MQLQLALAQLPYATCCAVLVSNQSCLTTCIVRMWIVHCAHVDCALCACTSTGTQEKASYTACCTCLQSKLPDHMCRTHVAAGASPGISFIHSMLLPCLLHHLWLLATEQQDARPTQPRCCRRHGQPWCGSLRSLQAGHRDNSAVNLLAKGPHMPYTCVLLRLLQLSTAPSMSGTRQYWHRHRVREAL